jgi:hypothetical protein
MIPNKAPSAETGGAPIEFSTTPESSRVSVETKLTRKNTRGLSLQELIEEFYDREKDSPELYFVTRNKQTSEYQASYRSCL